MTEWMHASNSGHSFSPRYKAPPGSQPLADGDKQARTSLPTTLGKYLTSFPFKVKLCNLGQDT